MNDELLELNYYIVEYELLFGVNEKNFKILFDMEKLKENTLEKIKALKWCVENKKVYLLAPNIDKIVDKDTFTELWDVF